LYRRRSDRDVRIAHAEIAYVFLVVKRGPRLECPELSLISLTELCVLLYSFLLTDLETLGFGGLEIILSLASHNGASVEMSRSSDVGLAQGLTADGMWSTKPSFEVGLASSSTRLQSSVPPNAITTWDQRQIEFKTTVLLYVFYRCRASISDIMTL